MEACKAEPLDRSRIELWRSNLEDAQEAGKIEEEAVEIECQGRHLKPVEIHDSISMLDVQEYGEQIDFWREHCRKSKEEQFSEACEDKPCESSSNRNRRRASI